MLKKDKKKNFHLKWEALQRMKFLDATLVILGQISTKDLIKTFGIGRAQATKDIGIYKEYFGALIEYDSSLKRYIPQEDFKPIFLKNSSEDFFDLFRLVHKDFKDVPFVPLVPNLPLVEIVRPPDRLVDLKTLSVISNAILQHRWISFPYQSLNNHDKNSYEVSPHSLVHTGFRWHVRGYSKKHEEFRDFVIGRFKGIPKLLEKSEVKNSNDKSWNKKVFVHIAPHPKLPEEQKKIVCLDYNMKGGKLKLETRLACLPYLLKQLCIGEGDEKQSPKKQQIILANKEDVLPLVEF